MIAWLFSWPPTLTEFIVSIVLALVLGWQWGRIFMARKLNIDLAAMASELRASNARIEKMMGEPIVPGTIPTAAQILGRRSRPKGPPS